MELRSGNGESAGLENFVCKIMEMWLGNSQSVGLENYVMCVL